MDLGCLHLELSDASFLLNPDQELVLLTLKPGCMDAGNLRKFHPVLPIPQSYPSMNPIADMSNHTQIMGNEQIS